MGRLGRMFATALCGVMALPPQTMAAPLSEDAQLQAAQFTVANSRFVMQHEIGHMYVDLFNLPVLGKEEDAVDMLATLTLLEGVGPERIQALADTADGWLYSERTRGSVDYAESDFSGQHSLDIQRSFTIACLVVGSDFETNSRLATRFGLSIDRQKLCEEEFVLARRSWSQVLSPFRRTFEPGPEISITYHPTTEFADVANILRANRVLEDAAEIVRKSYILPVETSLVADECGEVNAYYVPGDRQVILCYEWADFYYELFLETVLPAREETLRRQALKLEKIEFV